MSKKSVPFRPRRGRPNAEQTAAIEQAILENAKRMFLEGGYDAVTMEGIVAAVGVSKGTLYARYPSKEALFEAVVRESVKTWSNDASAENHLLNGNLGDRLRHHARTIAHSLTLPDVRAFQQLLLSNQKRFPELSHILYEAGYLYIVGLIAADIQEAADRDGVPVRDAMSVGHLFVSAITGWAIQDVSHAEPDRAALEGIAERCTDLFLAARLAW